jgi:hypothetical protein
MKLPSWLCIGVPKAGTTSLYQVLKLHPELWIPASKETHFFSSKNFENGLIWYHENFYKTCPSDLVAGELTPGYLRYAGVPLRIKESLGVNVKFIVLLRNPVDRAFADYCHAFERFRLVPYRPTEDLSFEDALNEEITRLSQPDVYSWTHGTWISYFNTGCYAAHLRRWFEVFPVDNFLILTIDELVEKTKISLRNITDHVGVNPFAGEAIFPRVNSHSKPDGLRGDLRGMLVERFRPHNEELSELLKRDFSHWNK